MKSYDENVALDRNPKLEDNNYDGTEVRLCKDGKYRWLYEVNMFKNPTILMTVLKVFYLIILGMFAIFGLFLYVIHADWEGLWYFTEGALGALALFTVLTLLGYLVIAITYKGKYIVIFEMDDNELVHTQVPKQFKKAQAISFLTVLVGLAAKRPSTVGAGMLSAARNRSISELSRVRRIKPRKWRNLIKVNELLNKNQVFVRKEDFDFVYNFLKSHCPNTK